MVTNSLSIPVRKTLIGLAIPTLVGFTPFVSAQLTSLTDRTSPQIDYDALEALNKRKPPSFLPGVRSTLRWSSNSNLVDNADPSKTGQFILEVTPYLKAESETPRFRYKIDYGISNLYRFTTKDSILGRQRLNGRLTAAVAGDWLWFDAFGLIANTYADLFGPLSEDPETSFVNTAQIRTFSMGPSVKTRVAGLADVTARYSIQKTDASRNSASPTGLSHTVGATARGVDQDGQNWNWSWKGEYSRRDYGTTNLVKSFSSGELFYVPMTSVRLTAIGVFDQIDGLRTSNGSTEGLGGGLGIEWNPIDKLNISAKRIRRYYGNSDRVAASFFSRPVVASFDYSNGVSGSVDEAVFSLDPTNVFGTDAALTNPNYQSQLAQNLRITYGIPYLAGIISDAFVRESRLGATFGLIGLRNSVYFSLNRVERDTSLFVRSVPAGQSGPRSGGTGFSGNYSGQIQVDSASLQYELKLDSRSSLTARASRTEAVAPLVGLFSRSNSFSLGLQTRISVDSSAGAGISHSYGKTNGLQATEFTNNTIYGLFDLRF